MKKLILSSFLGIYAVAACTSTHQSTQAPTEAMTTPLVPKNIIMVIADGMGPAYVSAYRNYMDDPSTDTVEAIVLDEFLKGTVRTNPHHDSGYITDSAASATALASGVKTYNGAIGMDVDKQAVETVLHRARKQGMKTGLAVTSTIVHATPAAYMVANEQRRNYEQIADSFFEDRINGKFLADVLLGAGQVHFIREDRNLVSEFIESGFQYVDSYDQLQSVDPDKPLLGLFGSSALPWAIDDKNPLRLSLLTERALSQLENPQGFFLLVEASQVDWAGHANDITSAMAEMHDFAVTVSLLKEYAEQHPDTLIVITADHSTGGLSVAASDGYRWDPEMLKRINKSIEKIARELKLADDKVSNLQDNLQIELTEQEQNMLSLVTSESVDRDIQTIIKTIIDTRTNTGWTTSGHTGVDVNIYALGPQSEKFAGNMDNTEIADRIFDILKQMK